MAAHQEEQGVTGSTSTGESVPFNLTKIERASSSNIATYRQAQKNWAMAQKDSNFSEYNAAFQKLREDISKNPEQKDQLAENFNQFCKDNGCEHIMKAQQAVLEQTELKFNIEDTQRLLNRLGYDTGEPDGLMGKKTIAAIQAYERDHHITRGSYKGKGTDGVARFYIADETTQSLVIEAEHLNKHGVKRNPADLEKVTLTPRGGETAQDTLEEMAGNLGIPVEKRAQFIAAMEGAGITDQNLAVAIDLDAFNISPGQAPLISQVRGDFQIS